MSGDSKNALCRAKSLRSRSKRTSDSDEGSAKTATQLVDDLELAYLVAELVRRFAYIQLESGHENSTPRARSQSKSSSSSETLLSRGLQTNVASDPLSLRIVKTATGFEAAWADGTDRNHGGHNFASARDLVQRVFVGAKMRDLLLTHQGCHALVARINLNKGVLPPPLVGICESYLTRDSCVATGYTLDVDSLAAGEWQRHKAALTWNWHAFSDLRRNRRGVAVTMWSDVPDGGGRSLPTAYAWRRLGPPVCDLRWPPSPIPSERTTADVAVDAGAESAPHVDDFLDSAVAAVETEITKRRYGGTIQIAPGRGKMKLVLRCICKSRARSIVVAHSATSLIYARDELRRGRPLLRVATVATAGQCVDDERQRVAAESDVLVVLQHVVDRIPFETAARFERVYVDEYDLVRPATLADWFRQWAPRAWVGVGVGGKRSDGGHVVADLLFGESLLRVPS